MQHRLRPPPLLAEEFARTHTYQAQEPTDRTDPTPLRPLPTTNTKHSTAMASNRSSSTAAALKEDVPGFAFDNYARNAGLAAEKKMHLPSVRAWIDR